MSKELIESVVSGKLDAVKLVLESVQGEAELHKLLSTKNDQYRRTVLGMAAAAGHLDIVEYLVEKGAYINGINYWDIVNHATALELAADEGHLDIVKYLVEKGARVDATGGAGTALLWAAGKGHLKIVEYLVEQGANINAANYYSHSTALEAAASAGYLEVVRYLVKKRAYVDAGDTFTALYGAAREGHFEIVKYLVEEGASINGRSCPYRSYSYNHTALHVAARRGHFEMVRYLVDKGAKINAYASVLGTVLHEAARGGHLEMVRYLVEKGASINAKDSCGTTALQILESSGPEHEEYREIVDFLKEEHAQDSRKKGMMYAGACVGAAAGGVALLCGVTLALGVGAATPYVAAILILCASAAIGAGVGALVSTFVEKVLESQRLGQSVNTTTP